MTEKLLKDFLQNGESEALDFKERQYFENKKEKSIETAEFVKDILSITNTIRKKSGYIIIGIKEENSKFTIKGIENEALKDDSIFQDKLKSLCKPVPKIKAYPFITKDSITLQIIEIPIKKYLSPPVSIKTIKNKIIKDEIYTRIGSSNSKAPYDLILELNRWYNRIPFLIEKSEVVFLEESDNPNYEMVVFDTFDVINLNKKGSLSPGNKIKFYIKSIQYKVTPSGKNSYYQNFIFDKNHNLINDNLFTVNDISIQMSKKERWGLIRRNHHSVVFDCYIKDRVGRTEKLVFDNQAHDGSGFVELFNYIKLLDESDSHRSTRLVSSLRDAIKKLESTSDPLSF